MERRTEKPIEPSTVQPPKLPFDDYTKKPNVTVTMKMNLTKKNLRRTFDENDDFLYDWLDSQIDTFLFLMKEC